MEVLSAVILSLLYYCALCLESLGFELDAMVNGTFGLTSLRKG